MAVAVQAHQLQKKFGAFEAVKSIDLEVAQGEIFGFLGPNGAGKSTTISMLCTLLRPTSGQATVAGYDVGSQRNLVRQRIGLVFQDSTLDSYLSAEQNLRFHAALYSVPRERTERRITEVLEMVDLHERRTSLVATFSGGMKRRLEIARGLLHSPQVLFLDEPTVGLDPQTRASIWRYITQLQEQAGITIFLTTHYMDEAEYCQRIAIIDHGNIIALDTPAALKASVGKDRIRLQTDNLGATKEELSARFSIEAEEREQEISFAVENGEQFVPRLFELTTPIRSVSLTRPSLDDVFMEYTGATIREAEESGPDRTRLKMQAGQR